jgi:hypothetical protein
MPPHQRPTTTCMRKKIPLLVDLMHTFHLTTHVTSSKVHSTCMKKSFPLRYATNIQNIFLLHNNRRQYIIFIFSFGSYIINSTMKGSYNQITQIYCYRFPQLRAGYSLVMLNKAGGCYMPESILGYVANCVGQFFFVANPV